MNLRVISVLLLATCFLGACGGGTGIYGTVTDGEANRPLAGASVVLFACDASSCEEEIATQTTGSDGHYDFPEATPGRYLLSITWDNPPDCPGIQPYDTLGVSGEFVVTRAGYGGLGGLGQRAMLAVKEFELETGRSKSMDLTFECP